MTTLYIKAALISAGALVGLLTMIYLLATYPIVVLPLLIAVLFVFIFIAAVDTLKERERNIDRNE